MHHGEGLLVLTEDDDLVRRLVAGDRGGLTDPAEVAMLDYAEKLTLSPAAVAAADVQGLRNAGFDDGDILDIAQVTAYYNFVNRTAEGLGVALEPGRRDGQVARWTGHGPARPGPDLGPDS